MSYVGIREYGYARQKLDALKRPYCQVLCCEVINHGHHHPFQWSNLELMDRFSRPDSGRDAWRHYGGTNPNSNGSNWLFADGHVQWHSVATLKTLYCCQNFPFRAYRELQKEKCGAHGGQWSSRRGE